MLKKIKKNLNFFVSTRMISFERRHRRSENKTEVAEYRRSRLISALFDAVGSVDRFDQIFPRSANTPEHRRPHPRPPIPPYARHLPSHSRPSPRSASRELGPVHDELELVQPNLGLGLSCQEGPSSTPARDGGCSIARCCSWSRR